MTILADLVRTRRERQAVDTNPAQFARMGEPWQMPSKEAEKVRDKVSRKVRDNFAKHAPERLPYVEPVRKTPLSEEALKNRHQREVLKLMLAAGTGKPSRTIQTATPDERERFLRLNTSLGVVGQSTVQKAHSRALHDAWVRQEREEIRRQREKANKA